MALELIIPKPKGGKDCRSPDRGLGAASLRLEQVPVQQFLVIFEP